MRDLQKQKEWKRKWRLKNSVKVKQQKRKSYNKNITLNRERDRLRRLQNIEVFRQRDKERYKKRRLKSIAYQKWYRRTFPEKKAESNRQYRQTHKGESKLYQKQYNTKPENIKKRRLYRLKNRDKINARKREQNRLHPEKKKEWDRRSYIKNREKRRLSGKLYHQNNKDKRNEQTSKYQQSHKEQLKIKHHKYYLANKERLNQLNKERYERNKERFRIQNREYRKRNPETKLKSDKKHYAKYGLVFNLNDKQYKWALQAWSKSVKKLANNICQVCDKPSKHSHHIFPKSKYPELSLNLNNGIALCKEHHLEYHMLNGFVL